MFIHLIPAIGTKYSLAKGLGTQYRDVSENEGFHFMVLSVRGSRAVKQGRVCETVNERFRKGGNGQRQPDRPPRSSASDFQYQESSASDFQYQPDRPPRSFQYRK